MGIEKGQSDPKRGGKYGDKVGKSKGSRRKENQFRRENIRLERLCRLYRKGVHHRREQKEVRKTFQSDLRGVCGTPKVGRLDNMVSNPKEDMEKEPNKTFGKGVKCKFCGKTNTIKKGKRNGVQRFMCKDCGKYFLDNGNFPRMHVDKDVIRFALDTYFEGLSVRKVARQIKKIWNIDVNPSTIYRWIRKYVPMINDYLKKFHPYAWQHDWHNDETMIPVGGEKVYFWDLIDRDTKFLLSGFVSGRERNVKQARRMYKEARDLADGLPDAVYCDRNPTYERAFHSVFKKRDIGFHNKIGIRSKENTNNAIERFHSTLKDRLKPMRGMQNPHAVLDGFRIHYNYLRVHQSLDGQTPAQASGIDLPFEDGWGDLIDWATYNQNGNIIKSKPRKGWEHKFCSERQWRIKKEKEIDSFISTIRA